MCEQHMKRSVTKITKRPQGKKDKSSNWAQCRNNWAIQLLIRFGFHDADPENTPEGAVKLDNLRNDDGTLPACFDPEN